MTPAAKSSGPAGQSARWLSPLLERVRPAVPDRMNIDEILPRVLVCTVATECGEGLIRLQRTCEKFEIDLKVFGRGKSWRGLGWRQRMLYWNLWRYLLKYDYVLFVDAYDTIVTCPLSEIMSKFLRMDTKLLFAAEVVSFPLAPEQYPPAVSPYPYKYLNAGGFIGEMRYVARLMTQLRVYLFEDDYYDQLGYAEAFVSGRTAITLDYACEIFQCLFFAPDDIEIRGGRITNRVTGSEPCIIHGNGEVDLTRVTHFVLDGEDRG
ncbi:MAG: hypothetical protein M5U01_14875 [Ardenticatenaceae bacterium]|nr:hypothetical protein [Ardenticatenaceae bacterium]HBY93300.1 hypothetical protein [Chloroflexota bacterium]